MIFESPRIEILGEAAFLIRIGDDVSLETNATAIALCAALRKALPQRIEVVPAFATIGVFFDNAADERAGVRAIIERTIAPHAPVSEPARRAQRTHKISVDYDGPDLDSVATALGIGRKQLIKLHSESVYTVMMLGFAPGFAYLGPMNPKLILPRRPEPRPRVPPGSVAIAGSHTAIYPLETPGGWHLIGRTKLTMFDPARSPAALLQAGDKVVFSKR